MLTIKDLMQRPVETSPDGKHWEPALPESRYFPFKARLKDAIAVWRGEATAIRQTTKADLTQKEG
jgi:hypothetical protein